MGLAHLGKSMGNPRVSGAIPVSNPPKNPHPHGGYGFSNGYAAGDPYSYPHGYEQMGSTCQRARIHSQTVILRVYTRLRACARESGEVALVVRARARARVMAMARHYRCRRHPRRRVVDLALSSG